MCDWTNLANKKCRDQESDQKQIAETLKQHFTDLLAQHNPEELEEALRSAVGFNDRLRRAGSVAETER